MTDQAQQATEAPEVQEQEESQRNTADFSQLYAEASKPAAPSNLLDKVLEESVSREAQKLQVDITRFDFDQRIAKMFALSGLYMAKKDQPLQEAIAQAMVKITLGRSMGFSEAESLQGVNIISGAAAISANLRAARMQAAGFSWDIQWHGTHEDPKGCTIWLKFKGTALMEQVRNEDGSLVLDADDTPVIRQARVSFLESDAQKMITTIWENNSKKRVSILEKDNWKMSKRNMYFARAITNTQRFYAPGVLSINLPSIEEAMDYDQDRTPGQIERERAVLAMPEAKVSLSEHRDHADAIEPSEERAKCDAAAVRQDADPVEGKAAKAAPKTATFNFSGKGGK